MSLWTSTHTLESATVLERYGSHQQVLSEKFHARLEGNPIEGRLVHQGLFTKLAVIVPGYLGIEKGYIPLARELAALDENLAVATFEPVRDQPQRGMFVSRVSSPLIVPHRLLGQSTGNVVRHLTAEHHEIENTTLIGHSTGGPGALNAAKYTSVNNVIMLAGAGVTGHTFFSLFRRSPSVLQEGLRHRDRLVENLGEEGAQYFMGAVGDLVHYAFTNPLRTAGEAVAVGQCDARSSIPKVRNLGTKVAALFFDADPFFPGKVAQSNIDPNHVPREHTDWAVDLFQTMGGNMGHLAPQTHTPDVALALHSQLDSLAA